MSLSKLKSLKGEMKKCFRCSLCKMVPLPMVKVPAFTDDCPISRYYHFHGYSGSGQQYMAQSIADGRVVPDEALAKIVFSCRACGYCDTACKYIMDAERNFVNMALREHVVESGFAPATHQEAMKNLQSHGSVEGKPERSAGAWAEGLGLKVVPKQKAEVLLFTGCMQRNHEQWASTVRKLAQVLLHAGVDVGILGDAEPCCGFHAYRYGFRDIFTQMASHANSLFESSGAKTVIAASGTCLGTIRSKYEQIGIVPKVDVVHATEFLSTLLDAKRLKLPERVELNVTYHDPCYLGRQSEVYEKWEGETKTAFGQLIINDPPKKLYFGTNGVYDAPRRILAAISGIKFTEMYRTREYAFCCGNGGGAADASYSDMARSTALHRLEEARSVGADCLITACADCEDHFINSQKKSGQDSPSASSKEMPVLDIIDLVHRAAGLTKR